MQFYFVATYDSSYEAQLVKSLLESHGIASEVINEESNIINPYGLRSMFPVRLIANLEDKEKITNILTSEFESGK